MKRAVEAGQLACVAAVLVGLYLMLPLPVFLVVAGVCGAILLTLVERVVKLDAKPTPEPETDGA